MIEAKRFSVNPGDATEQAKNYARQLNVPYIFLANGNEIQFWEWQRKAYPRPVKNFFKQDDLERRFATLQVARKPLSVPIDKYSWMKLWKALMPIFLMRMKMGFLLHRKESGYDYEYRA